jgi:choline dehydrogenase
MQSDYVVIGAGSSGCVVAARLAEAGASVALLEAGDWATRAAVRIPALYPSLQDSEIDWAYRTLPQPGLNGWRVFLSRGRGIGGSSLMNALVYMRGNRGDYDGWRDLGNPGWSYDDVLPLFKRSERNAMFGEPFHGTSGRISVISRGKLNPLTDIFMEACASVGLARNDDVNGERQEGYGEFQMTADGKGRFGADRAFIEPALEQGNLTVIPNARVIRLLVEKGRVFGAEYFDGHSVNRAMADGEVILSAGSINTPQILMLSGIGPEAHLAQMGIATVLHAPEVGGNLQDHLQSALRCEVSEPLSPYGNGPRPGAGRHAGLSDGWGGALRVELCRGRGLPALRSAFGLSGRASPLRLQLRGGSCGRKRTRQARVWPLSLCPEAQEPGKCPPPDLACDGPAGNRPRLLQRSRRPRFVGGSVDCLP